MPNFPAMTVASRWLPAAAASVFFTLAGLAGASEHSAAQVLERTQTTRPDTFDVLFIGNSHLFVNNVPDRVKRRLSASKGTITIQTFAFGGAQLSQFTRSGDVAAALRDRAWDVVVLQEASASFLTAAGRRRFRRSIAWFLDRIPSQTRVVLYQTWPWRSGSTFFDGRETSASDMWKMMRSEYAKIASRARIVIAPVGRCWINSPRRAAYYSADGVHASVAGSRVAAAIIARTILRGTPGGC